MIRTTFSQLSKPTTQLLPRAPVKFAGAQRTMSLMSGSSGPSVKNKVQLVAASVIAFCVGRAIGNGIIDIIRSSSEKKD